MNEWMKYTAVLAALMIGGIALVLLVYQPICETVLLRYFYSADSIRHDELKLIDVVDGQVVFSNGDRRPYPSVLRITFVVFACSVALTFVVVGNSILKRHRSTGWTELQSRWASWRR